MNEQDAKAALIIGAALIGMGIMLLLVVIAPMVMKWHF